MKKLTCFLYLAALGLSVNSLSAAANIWNGSGVGANTGSGWDTAANFTGGTVSFSSANDLDFSTITIAGPTTLTALAGTYAIKDLLLGTTASTITATEVLNINGNGTAGAVTMALTGNITLPSPSASKVTLGSDLVLSLTNAAHTLSFKQNNNVIAADATLPVLVFNSQITGGGASATFNNSFSTYGLTPPSTALSGAPAMVFANDTNTFDAKIGGTTRISGRIAYTSIGNIGAAASSLGAPSSANSTFMLGNGAGLDYVGSGNQTSNRGLDFQATIAIDNFASSASTLTFNGTVANTSTTGAGILRLAASSGNTLVMDTVIADAASFTTSVFFQAKNSSSVYTANGTAIAPSALLFTGTVILNGSNTYTGTTSLDNTGGIVNVTTFANVNTASGLGKGSAAGSAADIVFGGGTLQHTAANVASTDRLFTVGDGNGSSATLDSSSASPTNTLSFTGTGALAFSTAAHTLTFTGTNTGDNTFAPIIGSSGGTNSVVKSGTGKWILTGANTYTGTTTISGGTLSVNSISTVAAPAASALGAPATSANGTIAIGSGATGATLVYTGAAQTTDRIISLAGATGGATLDQSGTGLLKFTSNLAAAGLASTDQRKTLTLQGSTSGTGEISGVIADSTAGTAGQKTTSVTKTGTGTWTLSGANTYTGGTTIGGGTLALGSSGAIGTSGNIVFGGGALQFSASNTTDYSARIKNSGSAVALDTNGQAVSLGAIDSTNTAGLTKLGTGTLTLSAANTYSGGTTVNAGQLTSNIAGGLGSTSGALTMGGGTLDLNALAQTVGAVSITAAASGNTIQNGTLTGTSFAASNSAGNAVVTAILAGSGATLAKSGSGTLTLTGANSYTGATSVSAGTLNVQNTLATSGVTVSGGTLALSGSGTLGSGTVTSSGGTIDLGTKNITNTLGALTGGGAVNNGTITNNAGTYDVQNGSVGAALAGSNGLIKSTGNTVTLSGTNLYTGATTVNAGTLTVNGSLASGSAVTVNATGTLNGSGAVGATALSGGSVGGSLALASLTSTGTSSIASGASLGIAGGTSVSSGTLFVNGTIASGAVMVANTATLGGSGSIGGATTIQAGGTVSPGNSPGNLTFTNGLTLNGAYKWELAALSTGNPGVNFDQITVTGGNIDITGATMNLTLGSFAPSADPFWGSNQTWTGIINNTGPGSITGTFAAIDNSGWSPYGTFATIINGTSVDLAWTAIPEPSTYAAIFGALALAAAALRRRRS